MPMNFTSQSSELPIWRAQEQKALATEAARLAREQDRYRPYGATEGKKEQLLGELRGKYKVPGHIKQYKVQVAPDLPPLTLTSEDILQLKSNLPLARDVYKKATGLDKPREGEVLEFVSRLPNVSMESDSTEATADANLLDMHRKQTEDLKEIVDFLKEKKIPLGAIDPEIEEKFSSFSRDLERYRGATTNPAERRKQLSGKISELADYEDKLIRAIPTAVSKMSPYLTASPEQVKFFRENYPGGVSTGYNSYNGLPFDKRSGEYWFDMIHGEEDTGFKTPPPYIDPLEMTPEESKERIEYLRRRGHSIPNLAAPSFDPSTFAAQQERAKKAREEAEAAVATPPTLEERAEAPQEEAGLLSRLGRLAPFNKHHKEVERQLDESTEATGALAKEAKERLQALKDFKSTKMEEMLATDSPYALEQRKLDDALERRLIDESREGFEKGVLPRIKGWYALRGADRGGNLAEHATNATLQHEKGLETLSAKLRTDALRHGRENMLKTGALLAEKGMQDAARLAQEVQLGLMQAEQEKRHRDSDMRTRAQLAESIKSQKQTELDLPQRDYAQEQEHPWQTAERQKVLSSGIGVPTNTVQSSGGFSPAPAAPNAYAALGHGLAGIGSMFKKGGKVKSKFAEGGSPSMHEIPYQREQEQLARELRNPEFNPIKNWLGHASAQLAGAVSGGKSPMDAIGKATELANADRQTADQHKMAYKTHAASLYDKVQQSLLNQQKFLTDVDLQNKKMGLEERHLSETERHNRAAEGIAQRDREPSMKERKEYLKEREIAEAIERGEDPLAAMPLQAQQKAYEEARVLKSKIPELKSIQRHVLDMDRIYKEHPKLSKYFANALMGEHIDPQSVKSILGRNLLNEEQMAALNEFNKNSAALTVAMAKESPGRLTVFHEKVLKARTPNAGMPTKAFKNVSKELYNKGARAKERAHLYNDAIVKHKRNPKVEEVEEIGNKEYPYGEEESSPRKSEGAHADLSHYSTADLMRIAEGG